MSEGRQAGHLALGQLAGGEAREVVVGDELRVLDSAGDTQAFERIEGEVVGRVPDRVQLMLGSMLPDSLAMAVISGTRLDNLAWLAATLGFGCTPSPRRESH